MIKKLKFKKIISILFLFLVIVLWVGVLIIRGRYGAISWFGLMGASILGSLTLCVITIIMLRNYVKHKAINKIDILIIGISIILAYPLLWFFGIAKIPYPATNISNESIITIRLPVKEEVVVGAGGNDIKVNANHLMVPSERWAYDLVGKKHSMKSEKLEDYSIYGMDLVAPEDGIVIETNDKEKDLKPGDENYETIMGNHVYIKLDKTGTYLLMAHIKKGSILVKTGDHVKKGDTIAKVGNSGSSSEPHVHIQHQKEKPTETNLLFATAIPIYFENINVEGKEKNIEQEYIKSGNTIKPLK